MAKKDKTVTEQSKNDMNSKLLYAIVGALVIVVGILGYKVIVSDASNSENLVQSEIAQVPELTNEHPYAEGIYPEVNFSVVIKPGSRDVNVREEPVNGKVLTQVNGGQVFTVRLMTDKNKPIYLLNSSMDLVDISTGEISHKQKNYRLLDVSPFGEGYVEAKYLNRKGKVCFAYILDSDYSINVDSWYYLEEKKGWVISSLCEIR
jgi:hypothetical protein